jgi:FKBP-type peptidyl-prolyl cis-trans isomerase (trigger factor)
MTKTPKTTSKKTTPDQHDHSAHDHNHDHDHHDHSHSQQSDLIAPNSKVIITIKWEVAKVAYDKAVKQNAKKIKVDGFRKGKVPAKIAQEHLDPAFLVEKALQEILPDAYFDAIEKENKKPITHPDFRPVSIEMNSDWQIEASFAELPEVKLGKYQDIVKKAKKSAEKIIADEEKDLKKSSKEKSAEKKDQKLELTENQKKEASLHQIFKNLAEEIKPKVPELLLQQETRREFDELVKNLGQMNLKPEEYLEKRGMTIEQLSNELAMIALGRLQLDLILGEIAKQQKYEATKEDVANYLSKIEDEKTRKYLEANTQYQEQIKLTVIRQKVVEYLLNL